MRPPGPALELTAERTRDLSDTRPGEVERKEELTRVRDSLRSELAELKKKEKKGAGIEAGDIAGIRDRQAQIEKLLAESQKKLDILERLEKADFARDQIPLVSREVEILTGELAELEGRSPSKFLEKMRHKAELARARKKLEKTRDRLGEYKGLVSWADNYRRQWG